MRKKYKIWKYKIKIKLPICIYNNLPLVISFTSSELISHQ